MQPKMSRVNRKDNFSNPSGFSFSNGLHSWLPVYLFLSKSRFPVFCRFLISWENILVNCEPFLIMIEECKFGTLVVHTGFNWKWNPFNYTILFPELWDSLFECDLGSYIENLVQRNPQSSHSDFLTKQDRFDPNVWPQSKNAESANMALFGLLKAFPILMSHELEDNSKSTLFFIIFS